MPTYIYYRIHCIIGLITICMLLSCKKEVSITARSKPEVIIAAGDNRLQSANIHFVKDTVYILATTLVRNSGQVLTVDAGSLIKVKDNVSIYINTGGRIEANGTPNEPIVFTSAANKGEPGRKTIGSNNLGENFWYGISVNGIAGVSSGNLNFIRIEFAGGYQGIPGEASLTLTNIDKLTTIQNIQVSYSYENPSFGISGGNFNTGNLISFASFNSDFIIGNGYTGMMQNLLAYRHPFFSSLCPAGCNGLDLSGVVIKDNATFPVISNLTVIGPDVQVGTGKKYFDTTFISGSAGRVAALLIKGGKFYIRNSVLAGFPKTGLHIDDKASAMSLNFNESEYSNSIAESNDSNRVFYLTPNIYPPYTSKDFKDFILRPVYRNQQFYNFNDLGFTDPFNYDVNPDPVPKAGSPLLSGANFDGADSFFKRVEYMGAVGTGADNWLKGWTNFIPLQTDYNN
jgi:hypothetical protein